MLIISFLFLCTRSLCKEKVRIKGKWWWKCINYHNISQLIKGQLTPGDLLTGMKWSHYVYVHRIVLQPYDDYDDDRTVPCHSSCQQVTLCVCIYRTHVAGAVCKLMHTNQIEAWNCVVVGTVCKNSVSNMTLKNEVLHCGARTQRAEFHATFGDKN